MVTTFADLEARVRGVESRTTRNEEDITVIIDTVSDTLVRVRRIERAVEAIAAHLGVTIPDEADDEDE